MSSIRTNFEYASTEREQPVISVDVDMYINQVDNANHLENG